MMSRNVLENYPLVCNLSVDVVIVQCNFPTGVSSRLCDYGGVWHQPNVSTCVTREFINIKNKVLPLIVIHLQLLYT